MDKLPLVYVDEYGLKGSAYYYRTAKAKGISEQELADAGMTSSRVQVHPDLIAPLQNVDANLQFGHYQLYIVEGYRSPETYVLAERYMRKTFGDEDTKRILNMTTMPHATGKSVDVALCHMVSAEFVPTRNHEDGVNAYFVDFYKNSSDPVKQWYYRTQLLIIELMMQNGFRLGSKGEYFHYNYDPSVPENYTR